MTKCNELTSVPCKGLKHPETNPLAYTTTTNTSTTTTTTACWVFQGIKFKVIGPPSSQDVIDACAKDAVRYNKHLLAHSVV